MALLAEARLFGTPLSIGKRFGLLRSWLHTEAVFEVGLDGPHLLILLEKSKDAFLKKELIVMLQTFETAGAEKAIAATLSDSFLRTYAEIALKQMGPSAEKFVFRQLKSDDRWTVKCAIKVLTEIGTEKSLPMLKKMAKKGPDGIIKSQAQKAVEKIEARLKLPPTGSSSTWSAVGVPC